MGRSSFSPLGSVLAEIRERPAPGKTDGRGRDPVAGTPARPPRGPALRLETRVVSEPGIRRRPWPWPVSLLLHGAMLLAVVVGPLLRTEILPTPASSIRAFFVQPALIAPPPPPPPPAPSAPDRPRAQSRPPVPQRRTFTAPLETPQEIVPEETIGLGLPGGQPGGVEGGVPGGIVGGVVGGLPDPPPPPPVRVGGEIKEPRKLRHVNPVYPDIAVRANVQGSVVLECTISPQGRVTKVTVLRGIPLLDEPAIEAVKQWTYWPTLKDGVPVSVIMTVTVEFRLEERRR